MVTQKSVQKPLKALKRPDLVAQEIKRLITEKNLSPGDRLPRESELVLYTRAGAEIGVASTKAFTTQLVVLFGLAVTLGKMRGHVGEEQARAYTEELRQLPGSIQHVMNL